MSDEYLNVDVAELLAIIGERTVIARKQEQKIARLEARIRELEEGDLIQQAIKDIKPVPQFYERDKING